MSKRNSVDHLLSSSSRSDNSFFLWVICIFASLTFMLAACSIKKSENEPRKVDVKQVDWSQSLKATLSVDVDKPVTTGNRKWLIGSNIAVWNASLAYSTPQLQEWLKELEIGAIRMPGGSWSDVFFWNGNGVRDEEGIVHHSRMNGNFPNIDYSQYAPSILMENNWIIRPGQWQGNVDVKTQHEYINSIPGCTTLVTVNAGTGRPRDAAEWVRWANLEMGYNIKYWEVGNELEGTWEAGHFLPDGSEITGEIYARRFIEFAKAMKAVDPTIKIGGPAGGNSNTGFGEELLRDAGDYVDFFTWHTYPLRKTMTRAEMLAMADEESFATIERTRELIRKYQPDRADTMELMLTEWNLSLEGGMEADMFGARWSAFFIGNLLAGGMTMANHWDMFTHREGGSLFNYQTWENDIRPVQRKAQYWAFWLWSHCMGDTVVAHELEGTDQLRVFATRTGTDLCLMAINFDDDLEISIIPELGGVIPEGSDATSTLLSPGQVFWDQTEERMEWSVPPVRKDFVYDRSSTLIIPPSSIKCFRFPLANDSDPIQQPDIKSTSSAGLECRFIIDDEGYEDTSMEGWLLAFEKGTDLPYQGNLSPARLSIEGEAVSDRDAIRMSESAGRFNIIPTGSGTVTLTAELYDQQFSKSIILHASIPKPRKIWEFELKTLDSTYSSDWKVTLDSSIKANQSVARVDLITQDKKKERQALLILDFHNAKERNALMGNIERKNIRGVFFDIMPGKNLNIEDSRARIAIIMQSPSDYWMNIGSFPIADLKAGEWKTLNFDITDENHFKALGQAYNIWFVLNTSEKDPEGSLFIDNVGLMVR